MLEQALGEWTGRHGYRAAWGPITVLDDVRMELETFRDKGDLDPGFIRGMIDWFFDPPEFPLKGPKSALIVAVPRPTHIVSFETSHGLLETLLPPTYVNYRRTMNEIRDGLRARVFGSDHQLEIFFLPLKAAAARLDLTEYGRNNISYIRGMGSYYELVGLVTDAELHAPPNALPQGPSYLEECDSCDRCIRACPTQAIPRDRFLIHAERCLTCYNESAEPFPADVPPSAHHCLVGCLVCQRVCPLNKGMYRVEDTGVSFDREETEIFLKLKKDRTDPLSSAIRTKFEKLGLTEDATLLGRNLRALVDRPAMGVRPAPVESEHEKSG